MTPNKRIVPAVLGIALGLIPGSGCAGGFPVEPGYNLKVVPVESPLAPDHPGYHETLQVRWLGTGCYSLQLGPLSVLTDPFVSHHGLFHSLIGRPLPSDPEMVEKKVALIPEPSVALIGHGHWDHLLDLPAMFEEGGWEDTRIIGSRTTKNLVGYDQDLYSRAEVADTSGNWISVPSLPPGGGKIEYRAMAARHAPQFLCLLLYDGSVEEIRDEEPTRAGHFQMGQPLSYLVRLSNEEGGDFTVFIMTSASEMPHGLPSSDIPPVDVAILCVPSYKSARGYPEDVIRILKPRFVVLSHYNDFFEIGRGRPETLATADVEGFLREVQVAASTWKTGVEEILVPDVDGLMTFR